MSKSINNPNKFGTNDEPETSAFTPSGLTDDTDFPHTGLFKALNLGIQGNYVVSGFNISAATASTFTVAAGKVMKDGQLVSVNGASLTLSSTYTNGYHLLVAPVKSDEDSNPSTPDTSTVVLRNPTAANKIPEYTAGDTIIAIVAYVGSTGPLQVQYLTNNKTENSLSLGYNNSGYTETGTLTADANGITMTGLYKLDTLPTATVDGTNSKVLIQDGDNSDEIRTITASSIAGLGSGIANVVDDTTPQLGGDLDLQTHSIVTTSNRDINLTPDGTGKVNITGDLKTSGVQYQQFMDLTADLATGYHTIAVIEGQSGGTASGTGGQAQRGIGTFLIRNTDSSRHQTITLTASHLFGGGNGNGISVEHSSYFSTLGINAIRLKEASTYDGAVLQINIADATNDIEVYLKNNFQESGWVLIQAVADASDPSTASLGLGYNNAYSTFSATATTTLTNIAQLGQHIQGQLSVGNIRTVDGIEINGDLDHDGSNVGFFATAPASQQPVGNMGTSSVGTLPSADPSLPPGFEPANHAYIGSLEAEIGNLRNKVDALIDALQLYGLIS